MTLPIPAFARFIAGERVTAAKLNSQVVDSGNFFLTPPTARLVQTTSQPLAASTWTSVQFQSEELDNYGGWSTSAPTRYIAQVPGWYLVAANVAFAANATGVRFMRLTRNGQLIPGRSNSQAVNSTSFQTELALAHLVRLEATNFLEAQAFSTVALSTSVTVEVASTLNVIWVAA